MNSGLNLHDNTTMLPAVANYLSIMDNVNIQKAPYVTRKRIDANFEKWGNAINTLLVYPRPSKRPNDATQQQV